MRPRSRLSVALLFLWLAASARAQVLRFDTLTQDDGLSINFVHDLAQDSYGFLWIGTQDGLNRFDGYDLRTFRPDGTPTALRDGHIRHLHAGPDGVLWIGTSQGGVSRWDPRSETFSTWRRPVSNTRRDDDSVQFVAPNTDGTVWVGTYEGLDLLDPNTGRFEEVVHKALSDGVADGFRDASGVVWIIGRRGELLSVTPQREVTTHEKTWGAVRAMVDGPGGRNWAGTDQGALLSWDSRTSRFELIEQLGETHAISALRIDRRGRLWIGTESQGLLLRDPAQGVTRAFLPDPTDPHSFASESVQAILEDRSGMLWIGTDRGLVRHDPASAVFRVYRSAPDGPADPYVWAAQSDRAGNLYVGSNGGLSRFDRQTRTWRSWVADPANPKALLSDKVSAVLVDRSGSVWVGGNRGLSLYDPATDTFRSWSRDGDDAPLPGRVFSLLEARDGSLYVGTGKGVVKWEPVTQTFRVLDENTFGAATFTLAEDHEGSIWFGTLHNSLYRYRPSQSVVDRGLQQQLPKQISSTLVDRKGRLWIGTSQGMFRREPGGSTVRQYRIRDGLPNEAVMGFVEDARGQLWISTNAGIARMDPERNTFRVWKTRDGLPSNEFNQMAAGRTALGEVAFGTPAGLVLFDPAAVTADLYAPPVLLTGLEVLNAPVRIGAPDRNRGFSIPQSILTTSAIELSHREKVVTFTFAAPNFAAPEEVRYEVLLDGWDDTWRAVPADRRSETYTNLPAGNYVFRVRARNRDGVGDARGSALQIRVHPPPWLTWWAYTLYVAAILGAIALFVRMRLHALRTRQRELETLVQVRTAELERANQAKSVFLANMSHELRTPLNAVLGFAQLLRRSPGLAGEDRRSLDIIRRAGEHLLGLINDVLSISKIEAGRLTLDAHPFSLRAMIQGIESMMRVRADKAGLTLRIELGEGIPEVVQGDEGKLRQVLVNLLGNAVKFTKSGGVTLRATWSDGRATFEVEDTGPGIAKAEQAALFEAFTQTESGRSSKEGTGLGLAITRQIIRLMGGEIRVRSEVGHGSSFSFDVLLPASSSTVTATESRQVVGLAPGQRVPRVLVADDTEENRLLLVQLLGAIGIPVRESANGLEAVELWEREKPDLILMDMRMPVLDGREATRRIRARENGDRKTSIVALTASAFEHERNEILACGADDFLAKPFREEDLFRVISAQTGVQFTTTAESGTAQATITKDLLVRLSPEEASRLREVLETGDVEKAADVASRIRLRDEELGNTLLGEIRAYRVDHLLDLLENGAKNG